MCNIIILNGPPQSGKDEIAKYLSKKYNFVHMEIKELLFNVAIRAAGISKQLWEALYTRDYKEVPTPYLKINGVSVSPRQWMIHCSEMVIKPTFGADAFGLAAVEAIKTLPDMMNKTIVFSDGGFIEEIKPLINFLDLLQFKNKKVVLPLHVARIHREGYDWGVDSRRYLYPNTQHNLRAVEKDFYNFENELYTCAEDIFNWYKETEYSLILRKKNG